MKKELPPEPLILTFVPGEGNEEVAEVFKDPIARSIWLMIKVGHLTTDSFNSFCLQKAALIRKKQPKTARDLYRLTGSSTMANDFFSPWHTSYQECEEFLSRLLLAVTGEKPFRYFVHLPGSPEEAVRHRILRKRGFLHGVLGREKEPLYTYSLPYLEGYSRGRNWRKKIQEPTKSSLKYG